MEFSRIISPKRHLLFLNVKCQNWSKLDHQEPLTTRLRTRRVPQSLLGSMGTKWLCWYVKQSGKMENNSELWLSRIHRLVGHRLMNHNLPIYYCLESWVKLPQTLWERSNIMHTMPVQNVTNAKETCGQSFTIDNKQRDRNQKGTKFILQRAQWIQWQLHVHTFPIAFPLALQFAAAKVAYGSKSLQIQLNVCKTPSPKFRNPSNP